MARTHDDAQVHMELANFLTEEMGDYKELKDGKYLTAAALAEEQMVLAVEADPQVARTRRNSSLREWGFKSESRVSTCACELVVCGRGV